MLQNFEMLAVLITERFELSLPDTNLSADPLLYLCRSPFRRDKDVKLLIFLWWHFVKTSFQQKPLS